MIAIQPVYWDVGRIYRKHVIYSLFTVVGRHSGHGKHSFLYCCDLDCVNRAVAWQRVDEIRYNILRYCLIKINYAPSLPCYCKHSSTFKHKTTRCDILEIGTLHFIHYNVFRKTSEYWTQIAVNVQSIYPRHNISVSFASNENKIISEKTGCDVTWIWMSRGVWSQGKLACDLSP
jgi:hypothetical protein